MDAFVGLGHHHGLLDVLAYLLLPWPVSADLFAAHAVHGAAKGQKHRESLDDNMDWAGRYRQLLWLQSNCQPRVQIPSLSRIDENRAVAASFAPSSKARSPQ